MYYSSTVQLQYCKMGEARPARYMTDATRITSGLRGLDTTGVEVDEDQVPPIIAAGSAEEEGLYAQLEARLGASIHTTREAKLMCLRGRKYDVDRAADLLPRHLALRTKLREVIYDAGAQLRADLQSRKIVCTGGKDDGGRAVVWLRLRYHEPRQSRPIDVGRLLVAVMLEALKHADVQRRGVVIVNDMSGLRLRNLDPAVPKYLFKEVLPAMPVRVGRICLLNPPWVLRTVILPIAFMLMSKKLRARIVVLTNTDTLSEHVPATALPTELGGTLPWDVAWATRMCAATYF